MAKINKNYRINSAVVELLNELADRLNLKQGEVIEGLVACYGVKYYDDIVRARAEDTDAMTYLAHLADCVMYELGREEALAGDVEQ